MFVSQTVMGYLDRRDAEFEVVTHVHTANSSATARAAHIDPASLAKAVLMHDQNDYLLAVVPATRMINPWALEALLGEPLVVLADESELPFIFRDCERGAVPVLGPAFGLRTIVDDELLKRPDVYFEGGDHEHLVHMGGTQFAHMMDGQLHGPIGF